MISHARKIKEREFENEGKDSKVGVSCSISVCRCLSAIDLASVFVTTIGYQSILMISDH